MRINRVTIGFYDDHDPPGEDVIQLPERVSKEQNWFPAFLRWFVHAVDTEKIIIPENNSSTPSPSGSATLKLPPTGWVTSESLPTGSAVSGSSPVGSVTSNSSPVESVTSNSSPVESAVSGSSPVESAVSGSSPSGSTVSSNINGILRFLRRMVTDYPFFPPNTIVFIGPNINPDPKFNPNYFFDAKNTGLTISAMIAMSVESNNVIVHYIFFDDSVPNIEVHIKNAIFNTVYGKYTCANKHMINTVKIEQPVMDALGPQRQYVFLDNGFFKMDEYYWGPRTRNIQEINYTVQWYFSQEALRDLPIDTEEFRADKPIDVFVNEIRDMFKRKVDGEWVPELEGVCRFAPMYLYQFSGMKEQTEKVKKTERNYMVITENTVPRKIWSIVKFYFHKTREGVLDYLEVDYFCTREFTSGAGKLTISLLKDFCRLYGISEIVLYSDETAERFYKKEGFKEVGFCVPGGGDFFEDDALPKYSLQIAPKQPHHRTVAITNEESPKTKRVKKGGGRTRTQPTRRRMQKSKKHRKPVRRAVSAKIFSAVKIGKVR